MKKISGYTTRWLVSILLLFLCVDGYSQTVKPKEVLKPKKEKEGYRYPLVNGLMVGVNIFDPVMMLMGQEYGSYDFSAELNLHNRFFPTWEFGLGRANAINVNEMGYKSKPTFYNRFGMNYNFKFNSPRNDYFYVGALYGYSSFKFDVTNATFTDPYWDYTIKRDINDLKSSAHWLEIVGGIRVGIYKNLSMGWSVRYKNMLKLNKSAHGDPWFIPGYGKQSNSLTFNYSIYYQLPFKLFQPEKKQTIKSIINQ